MNPTSGAEDPIKYTKESLAGLRDVWLGFTKAKFSKAQAQATAAFEQFAEKLPAPLKKKATPPATTDTPANAPS